MATMPPTEPRVDTAPTRSVSFAPPETSAPLQPVRRRPPIPVGPGRRLTGHARRSPLGNESDGFPIQLAKVQPPPLRDATLERPRLLDWLRAKSHGRMVLLIADAGYGKTTLLADFARRVRSRTLWYRMDTDDRDWTSVLHHLVAAGRQHDATFAPETSALLARIGIDGPQRDVVLDTFIDELPGIVREGTVLILDDLHLVDDAEDTRHILRELVARAPERMTFAIASRRPPPIPMARLRAAGEVAELLTDDLRFDADETTKLFRETYGRRIEEDVLADLTRRTEGWIASLQMVQTALRDRTPAEIRRFVQTMHGADQELYDYLAEEVVGELSEELQRFLMETSILQLITPELAEIVTGLRKAAFRPFIVEAEQMTLLGRASRSRRAELRYHPLVREFLEGRLRGIDDGATAVSLHRRVAEATAATDWRLSAHHYREAADLDAMGDVIVRALPTIMGDGQYAIAASFVADLAPDRRPIGLALVTSRVDMQRGDYAAAITSSQAVLDASDDDPVQRDHALLNLIAAHFNRGDPEAYDVAERLVSTTTSVEIQQIAEATRALQHASAGGSLETLERLLRNLAASQRGNRNLHFGVTMLNLAECGLVQDRVEDALADSETALDALASTSGSMERWAALAARAEALARLGRGPDVSEGTIPTELRPEGQPSVEFLVRIADADGAYGSGANADVLLSQVGTRAPLSPSESYILGRTVARSAMRRGDLAGAETALNGLPASSVDTIASQAINHLMWAQWSLQAGRPDASERAEQALELARAQGAHSIARLAELLVSAALGHSFEQSVRVLTAVAPWHVTEIVDIVLPAIDTFGEETRFELTRAAERHAGRWRVALRRYLQGDGKRSLRAAQLLESIGETQDILLLRRHAKNVSPKVAGADLGRALARRLAGRVMVEDQGRVTVHVGDRVVPGTRIRRKVLALLCFLITRQDAASTRDQVLDSLWPDLEPSVATNSLNQTVYFLRRVFEPDYVEDLSPGYVHHDSDVIWLDSELVTSRSSKCRDLLRAMPATPEPDDVERLVRMYRGRFALDFDYEEWASNHRDTLHASYLEIVERAVKADLSTGHHDRGIHVARRALEVDSDAEQIEETLLRLYKITGAHAAAAEQYEHYAAAVREGLGIEPPSLESLSDR